MIERHESMYEQSDGEWGLVSVDRVGRRDPDDGTFAPTYWRRRYPTESVERVLWYVDRQIDAVLRAGLVAIEDDVLREDRAAVSMVLSHLPEPICSAALTRVAKRSSCTVVDLRCTASDGKLTLVSSWSSGPGCRPWVIGLHASRFSPVPEAAIGRPVESSGPLDAQVFGWERPFSLAVSRRRVEPGV
jgi:hypothetical protein